MAGRRQRTATPPTDDLKPREGFTPEGVLGDEGPVRELDEQDSGGAEGGSDEPGDDGDTESNPDPRDAEIARLKAENAKLRARAEGAFEHVARKYKVSLKDGPAAVVECEAGEHPFEAFKRATGVISSQHAPEIHPQPEGARCGICDHTGRVPEPK